MDKERMKDQITLSPLVEGEGPIELVNIKNLDFNDPEAACTILERYHAVPDLELTLERNLANDPIRAARHVSLEGFNPGKEADGVKVLVMAAAKTQAAENSLKLSEKQKDLFKGIRENLLGAAHWFAKDGKAVKVGSTLAVLSMALSACNNMVIPEELKTLFPNFPLSTETSPSQNPSWVPNQGVTETPIQTPTATQTEVPTATQTEVPTPTLTPEPTHVYPAISQEILAQLPEGWSVDTERSIFKIVDSKNSVLYVLDGENWREAKSLEYSSLFPPVWSERTIGKSDGLEIPITIGLTSGVVNNSAHSLKEWHMTEKGAGALTSLFLHACWNRYRVLMNHPDVEYWQYIDLVKAGKGNIDVMILDENGKTMRTPKIDPREGYSMVLTDQEKMPVIENSLVGFFLGADDKGRLLYADNEFRLIESGYLEDSSDLETYVMNLIQGLPMEIGRTRNECLDKGNVLSSCGQLKAPVTYKDWFKKFFDGWTGDPMFILKR